MTGEIDVIKPFNPRRNSKYIIPGTISLVCGIILDFYIFSNETMTIVYIPLLIMVGFLCRFSYYKHNSIWFGHNLITGCFA